MKYLKYIVIFFILFLSINVNAINKEDVISLANSFSVCTGSKASLIKGFKNSYIRMINERDISDDNLNIIYNNLSKAISIINNNDICNGKENISSNVKNELYDLYNKTNSVILSSPKIGDKKEENNNVKTTTKASSNMVIDNNNEEIKIYDDGVLTDVIKTNQKLNYVGLNNNLKIILICLVVIVIGLGLILIVKGYNLLIISLLFSSILLLGICYIFSNELSIGIDIISLMNVKERAEEKQAVINDNKIISYPSYGTKYGTIFINNSSESIYFGDSVNILKNGIGTSSLYSIPGDDKKIVLSGHNTGLFSNLGNLKVGNKVVIETSYAKFEYEVKLSKIVNDTDLNSLEKDYDLIMYTCYPNNDLYGSKRIIVYANLVKTKWINGE